MAASSSAPKRSSSPCGCGGSGLSKTSRCSCGGTGETCHPDGYARPRFFAGQLLTEDDLQQLNDYVAAKNRLHNRYLFGSGVVCGLEVTCHPCGGGKVIVNPGYALDCCGNDIVVGCPEELDINQMVRDLQRRMRGGYDCGDPCAGTNGGGSNAAEPGAGEGGKPVSGASAAGSGGGGDASKARKYCLCVTYCEQSTDPVAPYATDDPCGGTTCEATRIREGFRFELRCPDPTEHEPEICSRIQDCLGDATALEANRRSAERLRKYGEQFVAAYEAIQKSPVPVISDAAYAKGVSEHITLMGKAREAFQAALDQKKEHHTPIPPGVAETVVEAAVNLASDLAIFVTQARAKQSELEAALKKVSISIGDAGELLAGALHAKTVPDLQSALESELDGARAASLAEAAERLTALTPSGAGRAKARTAEAGVFLGRRGAAQDVVIRFLAEKVVVGLQFHNQIVASTDALRAWLVFRLEQVAMKTRCDLLDTVTGAPKVQTVSTADIKMDVVYEAGRASEMLGRAFAELWSTCFCNALNPPCPSCDDLGVLLACLTVEDCKVKEICNFDRQFVLSPGAIRYWIPEITRLGQAMKKFCCPDPCLKPRYLRASGAGVNPEDWYIALAYQVIISSCLDGGRRPGPLARRLLSTLEVRAAIRQALGTGMGVPAAPEAAPGGGGNP